MSRVEATVKVVSIRTKDELSHGERKSLIPVSDVVMARTCGSSHRQLHYVVHLVSSVAIPDHDLYMHCLLVAHLFDCKTVIAAHC
jgi:hypothetical protein